MKIFGIGFSGYVGQGIAAKLLADGHTLTGLARSETAAETLRGLGITPVIGSIADAPIIHSAAQDADAGLLLSTGGFLTEAKGKGQQYNNCIEAFMSAFEGTWKPIVALGGVGLWMGIPEANGILNETITFSDNTFYAEMLPGMNSLENSATRGVRGMMVIPGNVYGRAGGYIGPLPRRFEDYRKNGVIHCLYPTDAVGSFTHIDDLANAIALTLEQGKAGEKYIAVTDNVDILTMSRKVSQVCGLQGRLAFVDKETLEKRCGWVGPLDFECKLLASSDKIQHELGWLPKGRSVIEELQKLIDDKVDVDSIYPMKNRQATLTAIQL
ncbi:hypothetical protein BDV34DRAFT_225114 [Aspergillus parasiticus]|uniref:Uncharacterized protein n=1 Tax=Aspergillus parasiticus TaxID=5067 RepID=A0A5N6DKX3_ASPPA|nr:hypothetical protein BDV34DRAFT_225114 [Aspergillus parasiticus]